MLLKFRITDRVGFYCFLVIFLRLELVVLSQSMYADQNCHFSSRVSFEFLSNNIDLNHQVSL